MISFLLNHGIEIYLALTFSGYFIYMYLNREVLKLIFKG